MPKYNVEYTVTVTESVELSANNKEQAKDDGYAYAKDIFPEAQVVEINEVEEIV